MLVFSDLDRSVIYSKRFIAEGKDGIVDENYLNIEMYEGKEISFISKITIDYIRQIGKLGYFVPTTTRTVEQFKRIDFSRFGINFPWAITTNGGIVLENGEESQEWKEIVRKNLKESESIENVVEEFKKLNFTIGETQKNSVAKGNFKTSKIKGIAKRNHGCDIGIKKFRIAEDKFFYLVVDPDEFDIQRMSGFIKILPTLGWKYYVNGRKVYFTPEKLTKEKAIEFVSDKIGISEHNAIGDSIMDFGMLGTGSNSYILRHGDIENMDEVLKKKARISENFGIHGTEEILSSILEEYFKR
ncbi:MAG: hypothetical protein LBN09_00800 [Clostridioides sp.]|nr:hypothetical protein [Clostridioides sp.]